MSIEEFARAVVAYRRKYRASTTRWGSSDQHEQSLHGGIIDGPHGWDLACDFVYDGPHGDLPNRIGSEAHNRSPHSCMICSEFGLKIIHEGSHDHAQPADFPAGPVKQYAGETKVWV
jgi:hypothetical protein